MFLVAIALAEASLPPFEFRDIRANQPAPQSRCEPMKRLNGLLCGLKGFNVSGIPAEFPAAMYDDQGLFIFSFTTPIREWETVSAALAAKYGKPCKEGSNELTNGYGAKYQNTFSEWCFSDGKARFDRYGSKTTFSRFTFSTGRDNSTKPVVDF